MSDVHLTENNGILHHLLPGDVVLADRGFTIEESVGFLCPEVKHPPFTQGKPQLSKLEVDTSKQLSQVRILVERVIGAVRQKYMILKSTLPISMITFTGDDNMSLIDKVITIMLWFILGLSDTAILVSRLILKPLFTILNSSRYL